MIEKHLKSVEDVEQLILWMQAPVGNKPVITFDAEQYLERLQLANTWLSQHLSPKKVRPMLVAHYRKQGIRYGEATARRDVDDAMHLFDPLSAHTGRWWVGTMIDLLGESFLSSKLAHKYNESARIAKVLLEYLKIGESYVQLDLARDVERLNIIQAFSLEEAGIKEDPNAEARLEQWVKARKAKREMKPMPFTDASVESEPPKDGPDGPDDEQ